MNKALTLPYACMWNYVNANMGTMIGVLGN